MGQTRPDPPVRWLAAVVLTLFVALVGTAAAFDEDRADGNSYGYDGEHSVRVVLLSATPNRGADSPMGKGEVLALPSQTSSVAHALDGCLYDAPAVSRLDVGAPETAKSTFPQVTAGGDGAASLAVGVEGTSMAPGVSLVTPRAISALDDASRAAFHAADDIGSFTVKAKHLPGAGGSWNKFAQGVDPHAAIQDALRSGSARFVPNPNLPNTFRVVTDVGYTVGTRGETALRVIVTNDGRVINAFPVKAG